MLEIENLKKHYEGFELDGVSFTVPTGAVVGLIGENGAGKSTIIKSVIGAVRPDGGKVFFNGNDIEKLSKKDKQKISVVLDDTGLPLEADLKILGKIMSRLFEYWDEQKYKDLAARLQLPFDKPIKEFSNGMKMKAAIVVALSHASELLVLDEPTSGLDPVVRDEILGILYDYVQDGDKSVLISSHITSDLEKLCDYIVYVHKGKVLLNDEKDELLDKFRFFSCDEKILQELDPLKVERYIRREYGVDVLVKEGDIPKGVEGEKVSLDDLMLFYSRGDRL